jgi:hypothetical protein
MGRQFYCDKCKFTPGPGTMGTLSATEYLSSGDGVSVSIKFTGGGNFRGSPYDYRLCRKCRRAALKAAVERLTAGS